MYRSSSIFHPICHLCPAFSSPFRDSDAWSNSRHPPPPCALPATVRAFAFYRDKSSACDPVVDSCRTVRAHYFTSVFCVVFCTSKKQSLGSTPTREIDLSNYEGYFVDHWRPSSVLITFICRCFMYGVKIACCPAAPTKPSIPIRPT